MTRVVAYALALLALGAASPAVAQAPSDWRPTYQPHRAIYEVALRQGQRGDRATRIEAARGRLVYEFMGAACVGYTTNLRFVTELQLGEAQNHVSDIRSATTEAGDGSTLRFVTQTIVNGQSRDRADGTATRAADGRISVRLTGPPRRDVELAGAALFPTAHMTESLIAARRGERILAVDIYDGSEGGEKLYGSTAILRRSVTGGLAGHPADAHEALRTMPRWPMSISFFDKAAGSGGDQTPLYELIVEIYENGITHGLTIDYGDFALVGRMTQLELLPATPCN